MVCKRDLLACALSTNITEQHGNKLSNTAGTVQAAPETKTGNQPADTSSSDFNTPDNDKPPSPPSTGSHSDQLSDAPLPDAEAKKAGEEATDGAAPESSTTENEANTKKPNTFFNEIETLYTPKQRQKSKTEISPLQDKSIIESLNNFLIQGTLVDARQQYDNHLHLLYTKSIFDNIIMSENPDPQQEFQYLHNMHIVALAICLLSKTPTVSFKEINDALEQAKGANDLSSSAEHAAEPAVQTEAQPAAKPAEPEAQPEAQPAADDETKANKEAQTVGKSGGTKTTEAATAIPYDPNTNTTPSPVKADKSSPGDNGTIESPKETSSVNIFNIPNDSTYASSFDEFMKKDDPYELMYFFLLRNVEFVITGNKFTVNIQPPTLKKHIETLFTNTDFTKKLLKETTNEAFIADLKSVLLKTAKYIEDHITLISSEKKAVIALQTRVQSYRNRKTFFKTSVDQLGKGLKKEVFITFTSPAGGAGDEADKKAENNPRKYWEEDIVPLATLAPAAYVFIETCCPYVEDYQIHNIDKAQLLKLMISYLLGDKPNNGLVTKAIGKFKKLLTKKAKDIDTALVDHMMQTYNNTEAQKWRYPVLRDFKALFEGTSDSDACAYEYLRIHQIIRTSHIPSEMEFYSVGVRNIMKKEEEKDKEKDKKKDKKVYFPHTKVLVGSMAGNILTYSYPFRLDMPTFIYEHLEKQIETLINIEKYEIRVLNMIDKSREVLTKISIPYESTWAYVDPDKPDEPTEDAAEGQGEPKKEGSKEEEPEGQGEPKKEENGKSKEDAAEGQDGSERQDELAKEGPKGQDGSKKGGAKLNPIVINFIKAEVLDKLTNLASAETNLTYYYAHLKNILLQIVNVYDKKYKLQENKHLLEKANGEITEISITRSDVMARLNEAHNMLEAYKGIDAKGVNGKDIDAKGVNGKGVDGKDVKIIGINVNDELDLYEVYFNNIERVLYTQKIRSPGIVKPEVAEQADKEPKAEEPVAEQQVANEPAAKEPAAEEPKAKEQEGDKQEGDKPEPKPAGTEPVSPKKGGSQKKYKFKGRVYNIHEHRSIKYIITKEYGIVPIYS